MSHEMELEDFYLDARRKLAVVEEQNQLLREQNSRLTLSNDDYRAEASRLTLALDEALTLVRQYRKDAHPGMEEGHEL
jgi:hypothetical protein